MLKLFSWKGVNRLKQYQCGNIVAENRKHAQQKLWQKGFSELKLQRHWQLATQPKNTDICTLLNQLAVLLQSAIPLKNSLHILQDNCTQLALYQWLTDLLSSLEAGQSFSQSLTLHKSYLTVQEIQLIKVGEISGKLALVCQNIAAHRRQSLVLQQKLKKIMFYPSLVLAISVILTFLLLLFVVPQFAAMYQQNQAELPLFTQILLNLSQFFQQHLFYLAGVLLLSGGVLYYLFQHTSWGISPWLIRQKERILAAIPVLRTLRQLSRLVNFTQSLALMLQSGVPLNQSLSSFLPSPQHRQKGKKSSNDGVLEQEVRQTLTLLSQGHRFSASVSGRLFPLEAQQMLEVGEQSGKLALMLQNIATNTQQKLDYQLDLLSQLLEPILVLIIGSLIGIIMMGMYLPIFNMGSVIQ